MKERKGQARGQEGRGKRRAEGRGGGKRPLRVPPPESEIWPVWCRGKLWEPIVAKWFAGRCQLCAYACQPPVGRRRLDKWAGLPTFLLCTNHPDGPGELREVLPTETCRNFCAKRRQPAASGQAKPGNDQPSSTAAPESEEEVRRIPLSRGLFATVDAADYEKLCKYKWFASRHGRQVYAVCHIKGRTVAMHRMIMEAPAGCPVDHIDHNRLNNRRSNLRVCTHEQNLANLGPRGGSSRFVGVTRRGDKWLAQIQSRAKHYYLGLFDDEVEAAKARDRKAYELNGEHAYLNFPEDFGR